jgi:hypothetical protein
MENLGGKEAPIHNPVGIQVFFRPGFSCIRQKYFRQSRSILTLVFLRMGDLKW